MRILQRKASLDRQGNVFWRARKRRKPILPPGKGDLTCEIINNLFSLRQSYSWVRYWSCRHWDAATGPDPIRDPLDGPNQSPHPKHLDPLDHQRQQEHPKPHRRRGNLPGNLRRPKDRPRPHRGRLVHHSPFRTGDQLRQRPHGHPRGLRVPSPRGQLHRRLQGLEILVRSPAVRLKAGQPGRDRLTGPLKSQVHPQEAAPLHHKDVL